MITAASATVPATQAAEAAANKISFSS